MKPREFTGKCAICGKEMKGPQYGEGEFHDVCCKCFEIRFWDLIKQQVARGETYIINGSAYTRGHRGGFGNRTLRIKMLATGEVKTFEGTLWSNGQVPEDRLEQFPDNAEWYYEDETRKVWNTTERPY